MNDKVSLKIRLLEDMKSAMRAHDQGRLNVIRFIQAAVKQREIDSQTSLDDLGVLSVLEKMIKQHHDSIGHFEKAGRDDLLQKERFELDIIQSYLPEPLSENEIDALIQSAVESTAAQSIKDMGKVMAQVKEKAQGRADMALVSAKIKAILQSK